MWFYYKQYMYQAGWFVQLIVDLLSQILKEYDVYSWHFQLGSIISLQQQYIKDLKSIVYDLIQ